MERLELKSGELEKCSAREATEHVTRFLMKINNCMLVKLFKNQDLRKKIPK